MNPSDRFDNTFDRFDFCSQQPYQILYGHLAGYRNTLMPPSGMKYKTQAILYTYWSETQLFNLSPSDTIENNKHSRQHTYSQCTSK